MTARGMVGLSAALLTVASADTVFDWIQTHPLILWAVVVAAVVILLAKLPDLLLGPSGRASTYRDHLPPPGARRVEARPGGPRRA